MTIHGKERLESIQTP